MKWLNIQTSLFDCAMGNTGRITTIHNALIMAVRENHNWFFKNDADQKYYSGSFVDTDTIDDLRNTPMTDFERTSLKKTLQCWTPSGCYSNKSKNLEKQILLHINPVIQFDFDHLEDYDIEEVKEAIFSLPFICCVGLSCSGKGLFALGLIEEPEKLPAYFDHCLNVFKSYGLPIDSTKGRNYNDLRFVSYDTKMKFRAEPVPLKIKRFNAPKIVSRAKPAYNQNSDKSGLIKWAIEQIQSAQVSQRFVTVQKVAYSMGGYGTGLDEIIQAIQYNQEFTGVESKYIKVARDCFAAGKLKPIAA